MASREPLLPEPGRGHSLIELIVVMLALAIIGAAAATALTLITRMGRSAGDGAERLAAERTFESLVRWEAANVVPGADGLELSVDTLALREFRGRGIVCAAGATTVLSYRGLRAPDPTKDSLLVLAGAATEHALAFTGGTAAPGACAVASGEQTIAVAAAGLALHDLVLFFERGSYHLAGGALRYRRGPGGRQPVTADALVAASTRFGLSISSKSWGVDDTAAIELRIATIPVPPATAPLVRAVRVPVRNTRVPLDSTT